MRLRAAAAVLVLAVATACGSESGDDGPVTLTLWTRAATETVSKAYADAYNASHDTKVEVTAFPNEEYPAKLASVLLYNKNLYTQAGLDPDKPPTTLAEFAEHARAIDKLGGDVNGTYFGGNCGGCVEFTFWPSVWAAGGDVLDDDGQNASIDSPEMAEVFGVYRQLYEEGVAAPASKGRGRSDLARRPAGGHDRHRAGTVGVAGIARGGVRHRDGDRPDPRRRRRRVHVSILGGYAFGRFRFPGRDALFLLTLAILMVPYATILIALYVLLGWLGLEDSLIGLSLVLIMFQLPFSIFMTRNSFEAIPRELEESALVDGCTSFTALTRILLHAVRPGLITVALFAFMQRSYVRGFMSGALRG